MKKSSRQARIQRKIEKRLLREQGASNLSKLPETNLIRPEDSEQTRLLVELSLQRGREPKCYSLGFDESGRELVIWSL